MLSRNFRLQKVGNIRWIEKNYNLPKVAESIDELVVLDVSRERRDIDNFCEAVKALVKYCFIPVAVGGGITTEEDTEKLFHSGADKLVLNSSLYNKPDFVKMLVRKYGSQSIIASIDCKRTPESYDVFIENGSKRIELSFEDYLESVLQLNIGEVYLNSMDKDGTGQGYDADLIHTANQVIGQRKTPLIIAGGAGNANHFIDVINEKNVNAVATANIFNFIGDSLTLARENMRNANIPLAMWPKNE